MAYEIDRFKINWTERSKNNIVTSVTGYSFQIDSWKRDYFKKYSKKAYNTKVVTKMNNNDNTVTITVSRLNNPVRS